MSLQITYDIKAYISLLENDKGRRKPIYSGYRPNFSFSTRNVFCGEITLINTGELKPGDSAYAFIKLLPAKTIPRNLKIKDSFTLLEGNKVVGMGIIIDKIIKEENELSEISSL